MMIDVNAYLGHFALRRLRHNTAAALLALMDSKKIDLKTILSYTLEFNKDLTTQKTA